MPADLGAVLAGLGDKGASIFQAKVTALGTGVVTVSYSGGTFTDVPYMTHYTPVVNDQVYVAAQENWGLLCLGKPAPGPVRTPAATSDRTWDPDTLYLYNRATGTWAAQVTDEVTLTPGADTGIDAVYFFDPADHGALPGTGLAGAAFLLEVPVTAGAYLTLAPVLNVSATGALQYDSDLATTYRVADTQNGYVALPLALASGLIAGTLHGIGIHAEDALASLAGASTLRMTFL